MTYLPPFSEEERARILGSAAVALPRLGQESDGVSDAGAAHAGDGRGSSAAAADRGPRYVDFLGDELD